MRHRAIPHASGGTGARDLGRVVNNALGHASSGQQIAPIVGLALSRVEIRALSAASTKAVTPDAVTVGLAQC